MRGKFGGKSPPPPSQNEAFSQISEKFKRRGKNKGTQKEAFSSSLKNVKTFQH
jgi:hypothetical protein